ncbi:hypothetical protein EYC80_002305 [Monilinia laxa]|uniref:Gfd2/YDR514C-like C-terminal domain-containing protein n=1 Tax=Monilinia laxa TaxID=61186 RepID=A0A5N6K3H5_MONLA|nr:hypothetical protein EYC80_002305 [Monilinia laxa]
MADRIDRLRALTGQQEVYDNTDMKETQAETEEPFVLPEGFKIHAHHIYEGTSEEDNTPPTAPISRSKKSKQRRNTPKPQWKEDSSGDTAGMRAGMNQSFQDSELGTNDFLEYKGLEYGQLAPEGESFCLWKAVTQYSHQYIGNANRPKVVEHFFVGGKCYLQVWDFFYLYRLVEDSNQNPIILVPTKQVEYFLAVINRALGTSLTIPPGSEGEFKAVFNSDGTPYPRYLGRVLNKNMADKLRENVPPRYYKLDGEPPVKKPLVDTSLVAFRAKIEGLNVTARNKKAVHKEKQRVERVAKQRAWKDSTKRVQRYLGLRQRLDGATPKAHKFAALNTFYDPDHPSKFMMEDLVVFVCIDVEAYEFNNRIITEIGIATLDVLDIVNMAPGVLGENWRKAIRARHFRIKEHMHLNNTKHVQGCADRFEFGKSEIISIDDAPHVVGTCFKYPFSSPSPSAKLANTKRNIILVGHDVDADIRFLRQIGYEINNLKLHEGCDTTLMWRALKREVNPRSLATILAEIGISGWNLHNAGNDAVYTLQAMLGIACKHLADRKHAQNEKDKLKKDRISEAVKEAVELAYEREEGWSSDGSDGGDRITPEQAEAKKTSDAAKKVAAKRTKVTDVNQLRRDGSQAATAAVSTWTANPNSTSAPGPTLIPVEDFGYSTEYKSPYPLTFNPSGPINSNNHSSAAVASQAKPQDQEPSKSHTGYDWGLEWATRDTSALPNPISTFATTPTPPRQVSASALPSAGITGLEQTLQNTSLVERPEQDVLVAKTPAGSKWA